MKWFTPAPLHNSARLIIKHVDPDAVFTNIPAESEIHLGSPSGWETGGLYQWKKIDGVWCAVQDKNVDPNEVLFNVDCPGKGIDVTTNTTGLRDAIASALDKNNQWRNSNWFEPGTIKDAWTLEWCRTQLEPFLNVINEAQEDTIIVTEVNPETNTEIKGRLNPDSVQTTTVKALEWDPSALYKLACAMYAKENRLTIPELEYSVTTYHIDVDAQTADWVIPDELLTIKNEVAVVDIETAGLIDELRPHEVELLSVGIKTENWCHVIPREALLAPKVVKALVKFLRNNDLVGWNVKFDIPILNAVLEKFVPSLGEKPLKAKHDGMLLHAVWQPASRSHGLKQVSQRLLGVEDWDKAMKTFTRGQGHFERIPAQALYKYNAYDVHNTFYLWKHMYKLAEANTVTNPLKPYKWVMGLSNDLFQEVEQIGIGVNVEKIKELNEQLQEELEAIPKTEAFQIGDFLSSYPPNFDENIDIVEKVAINYTSPQQIKKYLTGQGIDVAKADEDTLKELLERVELAKDVAKMLNSTLAYRKLTKLKGTYFEGLLKLVHGDRVYPTYFLHGTTTGRTSAKNPNIQNFPRNKAGFKFNPRSVIQANQGNVFVAADFSQIELRMVAYFSQDPTLISVLQRDSEDFFDWFAQKLYPDRDYYNLVSDERKELRNSGKPVVHGTNYGRQPPAINKALGQPDGYAEAIQQMYFDLFPKVFEWREHIRETVTNGGYLITPFGRHFQDEMATNRRKHKVFTTALSFLPQSTASDICLGAAKLIQPQLRKLGGSLVAFIHDELIAEVPEEHAEETKAIMVNTMERYGEMVTKGQVPIIAQPEVGYTFEEL